MTIGVGCVARKNPIALNGYAIIQHMIVKMDVNSLIGLSLKCEAKNEESNYCFVLVCSIANWVQ